MFIFIFPLHFSAKPDHDRATGINQTSLVFTLKHGSHWAFFSVYFTFSERLTSKRFDIMRRRLFGVYQRLLENLDLVPTGV